MRIVAGIGALLFAYLALVPGGLVLSTLDSPCAGGTCGTGPGSDIILVLAYGAALAAIAGTSAALSLYTFRPTAAGERLIRRMLGFCVAAVALALLVIFAIAQPVAALVTVAVGAITYGLVARSARRQAFDPSTNGHSDMNGHRG
jgi:hypothetical protein